MENKNPSDFAQALMALGSHPAVLSWDRFLPRHQVEYQPRLVLIAQGQARGFLCERVIEFGPGRCLVLSAPLPFEWEILASPDRPFLALVVPLDTELLTELRDLLGEPSVPPGGLPTCLTSAPVDEPLLSAAHRWALCQRDPEEARVLGRDRIKELLYRVWKGPAGILLAALVVRSCRYARVTRALNHMHETFRSPLDVPRLAEIAGLSPSSFHHVFKAMTATSPVQYLKGVRLHRARRHLLHDGMTAAQAAYAVGYESPSQFNREYKRFFGVTPGAQTSRTGAGA